MQAYTGRPQRINLGCAPAVPALVWSFERRRDMSLDRCRGKDHTPGRGRRHRREVQSRKALDYLAALRRGDPCILVRGEKAQTLDAVLAYQGPDAPRWVLYMQDKARRLLGLAAEHGPASGWGVAQPPRTDDGPKRWTPYWVPKASEACWRWWRACVLDLARLLVSTARALLSLVPAHRAPRGSTPGDEEHVRVESTTTENYRGAGTSGAWVGALLGRVLGHGPTM